MILNQDIHKAGVKICSRCIYDERVPNIQFDDEGVCNYCHQTDNLKKQYGTGMKDGLLKMDKIVDKIKTSGRKKKYDCVVGVSGGTDSSYLIYLLVKKYGLRPLAVTYDNTWSEPIAAENMRKVLGTLDVDLYTYRVDDKEADDIFRAFFLSGVPAIEASTDLALAEILYRAADEHKVKYIMIGHSFVTEGIGQLDTNYFDGKYIQSIHERFGTLPMKTFPLMTFNRFLYWTCVARIKRIRPFWYLSYTKEEARDLLEKEFDWKYYGGHHLENKMTKFYHSVYLPQKFNADARNKTLCGEIEMGKKSREDAWAEYNTSPKVDDVVRYFKERLGLSNNVYEKIMNDSPVHWSKYPTYKRRFELLRPLFYILVKFNLVPESFYMKYCIK